jgi:predicted DCC family thiol-disulfide oxidoreductase YuxK
MTEKLLIYDGGCTYCRAFVTLLKRLDRHGRFETLHYDSSQAQAILDAQFGEKYGFAMYLFELDSHKVSWGAEAAKRVVNSLGMSKWLARIVFRAYPALVGLVSLLTRRARKVCGPKCAVSTAQRESQLVPLKEEAQKLALGQPN